MRAVRIIDKVLNYFKNMMIVFFSDSPFLSQTMRICFFNMNIPEIVFKKSLKLITYTLPPEVGLRILNFVSSGVSCPKAKVCPVM